jgi:hypothetical protein
LDLQVERLAHAGVDDPAVATDAHEEAADLLERPLRGRQADALELASGHVLEPLERERQVRAALGARHGVDLVDDHGVRLGEELARLRGQHQVERLGGGDEHVRRLAQHRLAVALGRVAGADGHRDVAADAAQRGAQVLLDVVGERLQGRHVYEPAPPGLGHEPVERPEEGGQRLARAGRRRDEHVLAAGDRGPRLRLGRGRALEGAREPVTDLRGERCERIGSQATHERIAWGVRVRWPDEPA